MEGERVWSAVPCGARTCSCLFFLVCVWLAVPYARACVRAFSTSFFLYLGTESNCYELSLAALAQTGIFFART